MKDIFEFFASDAPAPSGDQEALRRAAEAGDWAAVASNFQDALRAEDAEAVQSAIQLPGPPELATALAEAICTADADELRWGLWHVLRLDNATRVQELRDTIDRCAAPATAASEAAWLGLGLHRLREAVASEEEHVLLDVGRDAMLHVERNLGRGHELAMTAALAVLDACLSSERPAHWQEGERIARSILDRADEKRRVQASLELGFALALQHRWTEALSVWADLSATASRPKARTGIDRYRIAGGVHGLVSRARLDIAMSPSGALVAPVLARCEFELADLDGLEDAMTPVAAAHLRSDATSRVATWLAVAEHGSRVVNELVSLATIDSHTCVRGEIRELAAKLDADVRSEFERRVEDALADIQEDLASNAGNRWIDPEYADASEKKFRHHLRLEGLAAQEQAIAHLLEPRIRLIEQPEATRRSRLGGPPEFPQGFEWERDPDGPPLDELRLVALLDLDELRGTGIRTMSRFPNSGTLSFFVAPHATTKRIGRVLYFPHGTALRARTDLSHDPPVRVELEGWRYEQLPPLRTPFYAALLAGDVETGDLYEQVAPRVQGLALPYGYVPVRGDDPGDGPPQHHFGGYADPLSSDPYVAAAIGVARPPAFAKAQALAVEATKWRALLQLDSKGSLLATFDSPGVLSFLIHEADLEGRRFDRAWTVWQPY